MAIEPVTREERFLAAAGGRSVTPPAPITRKEQLLQGIIDAVKSGGATPDVIKGAVNDYLNANPVQPGATTEQAAQIEQNKTDIANLQTEVDELKESGGNGSGQNQDYTALTNKPRINGVELDGNKTSDELGIGQPSDNQVSNAVENWLTEHPEATTTVPEHSLDPNKTTWLKKIDKINVFNPANVESGKKISDDGTLADSEESDVYGPIPVVPAVYANNDNSHMWYLAAYDADGNFLKKTFVSNNHTYDLTGLPSVAFIKLENHYGLYPYFMISLGAIPAEYIAYDAPENSRTDITDYTVEEAVKRIAVLAVAEGIDGKLKPQSISTHKVEPFEQYRVNLLRPSEFEPGSYFSITGIVASDTDFVSGFIPVKEGVTYYRGGSTAMFSWNSALYDADKKQIHIFKESSMAYTVPTGIGAAYMRIAQVGEDSVLCEGTPAPGYLPPVGGVRFVDDAVRIDFRAYLMGTYGKRLFLVGDSITKYQANDSTYATVIARDWRYNITNYGAPGTKLTSAKGDGTGMCERIKAYNADDCDMIVVMGGTNDRDGVLGTIDDTDTTTVYGALNDICTTFITQYAGKRCGLVTTLKYTAGQAWAVNQAIRDVGAKWGIPVLDLERTVFPLTQTDELKTLYAPDGLHPSNLCEEQIIAPKMAHWLLTI